MNMNNATNTVPLNNSDNANNAKAPAAPVMRRIFVREVTEGMVVWTDRNDWRKVVSVDLEDGIIMVHGSNEDKVFEVDTNRRVAVLEIRGCGF